MSLDLTEQYYWELRLGLAAGALTILSSHCICATRFVKIRAREWFEVGAGLTQNKGCNPLDNKYFWYTLEFLTLPERFGEVALSCVNNSAVKSEFATLNSVKFNLLFWHSKQFQHLLQYLYLLAFLKCYGAKNTSFWISGRATIGQTCVKRQFSEPKEIPQRNAACQS